MVGRRKGAEREGERVEGGEQERWSEGSEKEKEREWSDKERKRESGVIRRGREREWRGVGRGGNCEKPDGKRCRGS